jgi:hypothetical protein
MTDDAVLFGWATPRLPAGRVRKGLEHDVAAARTRAVQLQAAGVATLRSLADQIDQLERLLRSPEARPYDRIPLTGLVRQFDDTYDRVFAALRQQSDPIARALKQFLEHDAAAAAGDTPGSGVSD